MSKCKIRDNAKLLSWQTPSCADNNELSIQNYVSCYSFFLLNHANPATSRSKCSFYRLILAGGEID